MHSTAAQLSVLTWPRLQPTFERALHAEVIGAKRGVYQTAEGLLVHGKTVEGWLYHGAEPGAAALLRLFEYFGPDFENAIRGGRAASRTVSLIDLIESERLLRAAADRLAGLIGQGAEIRRLREAG